VDIAEGRLEEGIIMPLLNVYGKNINKEIIEMLKDGRISIEDELRKRGTNLQDVYKNGIVKYVRKSQEMANSPLIPDSIYKPLLHEAPAYITNKMAEKVGVTI